MRKLILVGFLFIVNAVQATQVAWIDGNGRLIYSWDVFDGHDEIFVSSSYTYCMMQLRILQNRLKNQH
jgi:hypothetical protein